MPAKGKSICCFFPPPKVLLPNCKNRCCVNIYINNQSQELPAGAKITDALTALNILQQKGIAIAINNNVIPKAEWEHHPLNAEDKITLIRATQGG